MIKIRIEGTNPFLKEKENNIDLIEIVDTGTNSDATIDEYFSLFFRAMQGISFDKGALDEYLKEYVDYEL